MGAPESGEIGRLIVAHALLPHPEGGFYREIYRDPGTVRDETLDRARGAVSIILFLIPGCTPTRWHRVESCEIWHHLAGDPIQLEIGGETRIVEGDPVRAVAVVPAGVWQRARSNGTWSLASCTVAPAFDFSDFSLWEGPGDPPSLPSATGA